ncbi:hypothetical protein V8F06_002099 [Rhypophila decipiens]
MAPIRALPFLLQISLRKLMSHAQLVNRKEHRLPGKSLPAKRYNSYFSYRWRPRSTLHYTNPILLLLVLELRDGHQFLCL